MKWLRNLRFSQLALARSATRTMLSASGLAIGMAAVALLSALASGAETAFNQALQSMGKNLISVSAERSTANAFRGPAGQFETLTVADSRALLRGIESIRTTVPMAMASATLRHRDRTTSTTLIGTTPEFFAIKNRRLSRGRFLDRYDLTDQALVTVIGSRVAEDLYPEHDPIGRRLIVGRTPLVVVGVLSERGADRNGSDEDSQIFVPLPTAQQRILDQPFLDRIFVQARSAELVSVTIRRIAELLRFRHRMSDANGPLDARADDFSIRDQTELLATLSRSDRSLTRLLTGLAISTFGLGSIGLAALSVLSVRERRTEIGLRRAFGARTHHILLQFLSETLMIAMLGCLISLCLTICGITLGTRLFAWNLVVTWKVVYLPVVTSLAVAVVFGVSPAIRAARLDPIDTLRSS